MEGMEQAHLITQREAEAVIHAIKARRYAIDQALERNPDPACPTCGST